MLSKESKIRVLENFYALDYIFFGKPMAKVESCCIGLVEEYVNVKGALLSIMVEMYKLIEHSPAKLTAKLTTREFTSNAKRYSAYARQSAKKLVTTEKAKQNIKEQLKLRVSEKKDMNIPTLVENLIREKAFKLAVDHLLIARTIAESKNVKNMNEWTGKLLEDSYKILRDSVVESALTILENGGKDI
jgi:hypothetical protein